MSDNASRVKASIVDKEGVAIRTGHHCAQPIMDFYEVSATARASIAHYNTKNDIFQVVEELKKL